MPILVAFEDKPGIVECQDCGVHLQVDPRGDIQNAACPDCGGTRMFRNQPSPTQSDGAIRDLVNMETGKDEGGNPLMEGILASLIQSTVNQCVHCHTVTDQAACPTCGAFMGGDVDLPPELRPEIAGAPLTEGTIMQTDHTDPLDTGSHGRDEYTHGSVLAAWGPHDPIEDLRCPNCKSGEVTHDPENGDLYCTNCDMSWPIHGENYPQKDWLEPLIKKPGRSYAYPGNENINPDAYDLGPRRQGAAENGFMNWTPGMYGRGIIIAGEPHTWNALDPRLVDEGKYREAEVGPLHNGYVKYLGIDPKHVDVHTGIDIYPDGRISKDISPFIEADPRLKPLEGNQFQSAMSKTKFERTNNMDTYPALFHEAEGSVRQGGLALAIPAAEALGDATGLIGGGEAAAGAAGAGSAAPGLMQKVLGIGGQAAEMEGGADLINKGLGTLGIGGGGGQQQPTYQSPLNKFTHVDLLSSLVTARGGEYETPTSNPDVGIKHDDPEDVDQKEFNDQDKSPENLNNPNLQDSGASTEDEVRENGGFGPNSRALERMEMLMPLLENYYHSGESGAHDPLVKSLHEMLEAENPGYLDGANPELTEQFFRAKKQPQSIHASAPELPYWKGPAATPCANCQGAGCEGCNNMGVTGEPAAIAQHAHQRFEDQFQQAMQDRRQQDRRQNPVIGPALQFMDRRRGIDRREGSVRESIVPAGGLQEQQRMLDPTALNPSQQPSSMTPPGGSAQGGHCQNCGGTLSPDGSCAQCGMRENAAGSVVPQGMPGQMVPGMQAFTHFDLISSLVKSNYDLPTADDYEKWDDNERGIYADSLANQHMEGVHDHIGAEHPDCPICLEEFPHESPYYRQAAIEIDLTPPSGRIPCPDCPPWLEYPACPKCHGTNYIEPKPPVQHSLREFIDPFHPQGEGEEVLNRSAANHQGPVTPEQISAVQQWLIENGRVEEVSNVPLDPGNPEYAKILAEIQNNPTVPPTVTPEEQTQPPPPPQAQPGAMPMPGMAPGETGGQPMQPMSSFLPEFNFTAADNVAKRCPNCGSGTTGMVGDIDSHAHCHACGHTWKEDALNDMGVGNSTLSSRTADEHGPEVNPVNVPAAEQHPPTDRGGDEDSSLTWQDTEGNPLKAKSEYVMHNPSYSLPDVIRVERVKPDGIDVTMLGTFGNENTLQSSIPISKERVGMEHITFEPVPQNADEHNPEPPPGSQAPGEATIPPSGQTTDEHTNSELPPAQSSAQDICPRCGHNEHTSSMINPEATEHDCFRCGHNWVTEERDDQRQAAIDLSWLNEDDEAEDFLTPRRQGMASAQSRDLKAIARKDARLQEIHDYLDNQKTAGRHFTPKEQRELIDERGHARNADRLDLEGTHYITRDSFDSKANPERVRDADLFLGL